MEKYKILSLEKARSDAEKRGFLLPFDIGFPLFEISDETIKEIYDFRWSVFRKHIKKTSHGYVITEFLQDVPWAGAYNTISCAASHHFAEGRWLHNREIISSYAKFWFSEEAEARKYSFPIADSIYRFCEVIGDFSLAYLLYEPMKENFAAWEASHKTDSGLFYQTDNRDGMELSISGNGLRPTINSYMYAEATAISKIASGLDKESDQILYSEKAKQLKLLINTKLWDDQADFYKTLSEDTGYRKSDVRELIGYVPWCFFIPENAMDAAWKFLLSENHFAAPYGPTTAERCHKDFMKPYTHECRWNGPSWPFATTQTLSAMINAIRHYKSKYVNASDFYSLLLSYAKSHYITENGIKKPHIDENLNPFTGSWEARDILLSALPERSDRYRGKDYNHSAFCDLVIRGLCGINIKDGEVYLSPLFDPQKVEYFCLDGVLVGEKYYTALYDRDGKKYGRGKGLKLLS